MRKRYTAQNLYKTTLTNPVPAISAVWDWYDVFTIVVDEAPSTTLTEWFLIIDYNNAAKRDEIKFHAVSGSTFSYYRKDRDLLNTWAISKRHDSGAYIQINVVQEYHKHLYDNLDDFWYIEDFGGDDIRVFGGIVDSPSWQVTVADTNLYTLTDGTWYIFFDYADNTFKKLASTSWYSWIAVATVVVASNEITSITDTRPLVVPVRYDSDVFEFSATWELKLINNTTISDATTSTKWRSRLSLAADIIARTAGAIALTPENTVTAPSTPQTNDEWFIPALDSTWMINVWFLPTVVQWLDARVTTAEADIVTLEADVLTPTYLIDAWEDVAAGDVLRCWLSFAGDSISQVSADGKVNLWYSTTLYYVWQSFTTVNGWALSSIGVYLYKIGTPTWTITCNVYNSTGTLLIETSSTTINEADLWTSSGGTLQTFTFSWDKYLEAATVYYIELQFAWRAVSTSNYTWVREWAASDLYAWGDSYLIDNANTWSVNSWDDLRFSVTVSAVSETTTKAYKASASTWATNKVIWFARAITVADNPITVDVAISKTQTWLTAWQTYYLSNTEWAVSTSIWSSTVTIWRAVSATTLVKLF